MNLIRFYTALLLYTIVLLVMPFPAYYVEPPERAMTLLFNHALDESVQLQTILLNTQSPSETDGMQKMTGVNVV